MRLQTLFRHITGYLFGLGVFIVAIPSGLYFLSTALDPYVPVRLTAAAEVRIGISLLLAILGLVFVVWSNVYLFVVGKGGPADVFGVTVSPQTQHLVTGGPYRYTRNPMVFGANTVYIALAVYLDSLAGLGIMVVFITGVVIYLKRVEEKRLLRDFGDAFERYRQAVSILVPLPPRGKI